MLRLARRSPLAEKPIGPLGLVLLLMGGLTMLAPFYFMFVFATQPREEIFSVPPPLWFGTDFFSNMELLMSIIPVLRNLGWSFYVAIMSTGLTLLFCSMGGYAFAIYEFREC